MLARIHCQLLDSNSFCSVPLCVLVCVRKRERDTQREGGGDNITGEHKSTSHHSYTHKHTHTQTHTEKERETHTVKGSDREKDTLTHIRTFSLTVKGSDREKDTLTHIHTFSL